MKLLQPYTPSLVAHILLNLEPILFKQFGYTIKMYDSQSCNILAIHQHSLLLSLATAKLDLGWCSQVGYMIQIFSNQCTTTFYMSLFLFLSLCPSLCQSVFLHLSVCLCLLWSVCLSYCGTIDGYQILF